MIAAVVYGKIAEHSSNTVWIAAHSNVAVKNVAEKLVDSGFLDFRLLVSRDFPTIGKLFSVQTSIH